MEGGKQSTVERLDKKANQVISKLTPLTGLSFLNGTGAVFDEKLFLASMEQMVSNPGKVYDDFSKAAMLSAAPTKNNIPKDIVTNNNQQTSNNVVNQYHIDKVELQGVKDVQEFMHQLSNFDLYAKQHSGRRR